MARSLGHKGVSLAHYVFDGALHQSLSKKFKKEQLKAVYTPPPSLRGRAGGVRLQGARCDVVVLAAYFLELKACVRCLATVAHFAEKFSLGATVSACAAVGFPLMEDDLVKDDQGRSWDFTRADHGR